jgi:hypothetical protein
MYIYVYIYRVFHNLLRDYKNSDRTMALGFTQLPTEMSTRNISSGVKVVGA